jgi:hypothetical protein
MAVGWLAIRGCTGFAGADGEFWWAVTDVYERAVAGADMSSERAGDATRYRIRRRAYAGASGVRVLGAVVHGDHLGDLLDVVGELRGPNEVLRGVGGTDRMEGCG